MYFDNKPCAECGSEVELRARESAPPAPDGKAGPEDGYVGDADSTVDARVCTNKTCPTNSTPPGEDPQP